MSHAPICLLYPCALSERPSANTITPAIFQMRKYKYTLKKQNSNNDKSQPTMIEKEALRESNNEEQVKVD